MSDEKLARWADRVARMCNGDKVDARIMLERRRDLIARARTVSIDFCAADFVLEVLAS